MPQTPLHTHTKKWERVVVLLPVQIDSTRKQSYCFIDRQKLNKREMNGINAIRRNHWNPGTKTYISSCRFGSAVLDFWRRKNRKKKGLYMEKLNHNAKHWTNQALDKLSMLNNSQILDYRPWCTTCSHTPKTLWMISRLHTFRMQKLKTNTSFMLIHTLMQLVSSCWVQDLLIPKMEYYETRVRHAHVSRISSFWLNLPFACFLR